MCTSDTCQALHLSLTVELILIDTTLPTLSGCNKTQHLLQLFHNKSFPGKRRTIPPWTAGSLKSALTVNKNCELTQQPRADRKIFKCTYNIQIKACFFLHLRPIHYLRKYSNHVLQTSHHLIKYTRKAPLLYHSSLISSRVHWREICTYSHRQSAVTESVTS